MIEKESGSTPRGARRGVVVVPLQPVELAEHRLGEHHNGQLARVGEPHARESGEEVQLVLFEENARVEYQHDLLPRP